MTEIFDLDIEGAERREQIRNFQNSVNDHIDIARPEDAGALETAGLIWSQETIIGSAIAYGLSKDTRTGFYEYDKNFNPIRLWSNNRDQFDDISPYIRQGMFNDVISEQQFLDRRERLLDEQKRRERIANGSGWGMALGMGLSLIDIATLMPIGGWVSKGNTLAKVGKMAFAGSTLTAAQEAVLHMQQDLRTNEESFMNIGISAPIGGGFGLFASALNPASKLNPKHPENPFHRNNNIGMGIAKVGGAISDSVIFKRTAKGVEVVRDSSVGAATIKTGKVVKASVVDLPLRTLAKALPVGRMLYARSNKTREIGQKLVDGGGIRLDTDEVGKVVLSVDDYKPFFMNDFNQTFENSAAAFNEIQEQLAEILGQTQNSVARSTGSSMRQAGRFFTDQANVVRGRESGGPQTGGHFEDFEFQDVTYKILFEDLDQNTIKNLTDRFGDKGSGIIMKAARKQAGDIHQVNQRMENLMVEAGMITDKQRMGDDYGLAQLWNPRSMRGGNREAAVNFFMSKFLDKPTNTPTERYPNGYLMDEFGITDDQYALLGREEVKVGDEVLSVEQGITAKREILEDWSGNTYDRAVLQAEMDLKNADASFDASRKEAVWSSRDLRRNETEYRHSTVEEAKKILEHRVLERDRAVAERQKLTLERQANDVEIRQQEAELKARMGQFQNTGSATRELSKDRGAAKQTALDEYSEAVESAKTTSRPINTARFKLEQPNFNNRAIKAAGRKRGAANEAIAAIPDDALDATVAKAATRPIKSDDLIRLKDRQAQIARRLSKLENRLERMDPKIARVSDAVEEATEAKRAVESGKSALRDAKKEANKAFNAAKKDKKKAERVLKRNFGLSKRGSTPDDSWLDATYGMKRAAYLKLGKEDVTVDGKVYDVEAGKVFRKEVMAAYKKLPMERKTAGRQLPVHMYVENLVDKLGKQNKIPRGVLETEAFASNRTKDRQIHLTNAERREAVRLGLLRNDLYGVMHSAHEDIAARLALRKVFGTENVDDIIPDVKADYQSLIDQARNRKDLKNPEKYIARLKDEMNGRIEDIKGLWDRQLGLHGLPDDPDGYIHWSLQKLRALNFIKYGTGFLVSSLTDPASVALTAGFHALSMKNYRAMKRAMKGSGSDEVRRVAVESERVLHNHRTLKIADVEDIRTMSGIGDRGSMKHNVTSGIDRAMQGMTDTASVLSGMIWWNTRLKAMAIMEMQHNLVSTMKQYDSLFAQASAGNKKARLEISNLASIGIGTEQARRISQMMQKHPPIKNEGVFEIEMSRWLNEGDIGQKAYTDVEFAMRRVSNRAVMTPGVGETPLFMSKGYAKTMMQFQTYGFVVVNRFIVPALQRGISYGDMTAILSMGLAAMLGTVVVGAKDLLRTGEIKERNATEWAYDTLDRSGYLMYLTVPSSIAFNAANVVFGLKSAPSRYANQNNIWGILFGPSANTLMDISGLAGGIAYGDADAIAKHGSKLLPFQILKQVGDRVVDFGD